MDLKTTMHPNARHVFFQKGDLSYAFTILHVDGSFIYFRSQSPIKESFESGHFLSFEDKGIVQFSEPQIDSLAEENCEKFGAHVHRLNLKDVDLSISNRRTTARFEFQNFIPFVFSVYGETISAQLVNISDGGLRMQVNTHLKKDVLCQLELNLPEEEGRLIFSTNAVVVYVEETGKNTYMVGLSFVAPDFENDDEKQDYISAKEGLRSYILRNVA